VNELIVIVMGSKADEELGLKVKEAAEALGVQVELRIASAHKSTPYLLQMIDEYDSKNRKVVYIAVAGRSNALVGVIDGNSSNPVITCPNISKELHKIDIFSSLRMPSGIAPAVILEPESAALMAVKILAQYNDDLKKKVKDLQQKNLRKISKDDEELKRK